MSSTLTETIAILGDLVAFPTISGDGNLAMIGYLSDRLETVGAQVSVFHDESGTRANLFATIGPPTDGGVVLSGHTDVVPVTGQRWRFDPFAMRRSDDVLYGRGTCDMKGFIAATLAAAPLLSAANPKRPVHFAFTYDEEIGCFGARALVETLQGLGIRPAIALIGEPTEMRVVEAHKGCCHYTTRFVGLAGHGSRPEGGVNALEYATRFVSRLLELQEVLRSRAPAGSPFDPPWTTVNIGRMAGGTAHNVIAGHAVVDWELRPVRRADAEFLRKECARHCAGELLPAMRTTHAGADIVTETIAEVEALAPAGNDAARQMVMELAGADRTDAVAFSTEAGLYASLGLSAFVCGPGSIAQAHKADEFVEIDQLSACLAMLERLAGKLHRASE